MAKKFVTSDLIKKIERLTKQRMSEQPIVSLDEFRGAHKKMNPQNILVIEDDETQRMSLKRILEAEGYTALIAADSAELTTLLDEEKDIHLILMDIGLPWINGFELAEMMKEHLTGLRKKGRARPPRASRSTSRARDPLRPSSRARRSTRRPSTAGRCRSRPRTSRASS